MKIEEKPLLSIIIPHKDSKLTLVRLLKTIQVHGKKAEVIVVDDGSSREEDPADLANQFKQVVFLKNHGPDFNAGKARNIGIKYSSGEWLLFGDSDDKFSDNGIELVLKEISKSENEVDIIFFDATSWNPETKTTGKRHQGISDKIDGFFRNRNEEEIRFQWPHPVAKAFRSSLVKDNGIRFDSIIASNDVMFSFLCGFYANRIKVINETIYCIYESPLSLSGKLTPPRALARLDTLIRKNSMMMDLGINGRLDRGYSWFFVSLRGRRPLIQFNVYRQFCAYTIRRILFRAFNRK